jgi:hypothetical protein
VACVRRAAAAVLVVLLVSAALTSCTSSTESYCSLLKDDQAKLKKDSTDAAKPGSDALGHTVTLLTGLQDKAPDDISGEWDTLVSALKNLEDAVRATGADYGDFVTGKKPAGVTDGQFRAVQQAAGELSSTRVQQAATSIEQHAQDVCKVDLGGGLGTS